MVLIWKQFDFPIMYTMEKSPRKHYLLMEVFALALWFKYFLALFFFVKIWRVIIHPMCLSLNHKYYLPKIRFFLQLNYVHLKEPDYNRILQDFRGTIPRFLVRSCLYFS